MRGQTKSLRERLRLVIADGRRVEQHQPAATRQKFIELFELFLVPLVVPIVKDDAVRGLKLFFTRPLPRGGRDDVRSRRREEAEPVLLPRRVIVLTGAVVLLRSDEEDFQFTI